MQKCVDEGLGCRISVGVWSSGMYLSQACSKRPRPDGTKKKMLEGARTMSEAVEGMLRWKRYKGVRREGGDVRMRR